MNKSCYCIYNVLKYSVLRIGSNMTDNISGVLKTPDITKQTLQLRNSLKSCHKGDIENIYNNNENGLIYDEDHSLIDLSNSFSYSDEQRKGKIL